MNWLDILLRILIGTSVVSSILRGFLRECISLLAVLVGLVCGLWLYGSAGAFLLPFVSSKGIANFCGFFLVFGGIVLLGALTGTLLSKMLKWAGLSWLDRILGAAFGFLRGLVMATAVVLAILAFPALPPARAVVESRMAPYLIEAAHIFAAMAPRELKEGFRESYEQVQKIWADALKKRDSVL